MNADQSEGARRNLAVGGKEVCFCFVVCFCCCSCNILNVVRSIEEMIKDVG